MSACKHGRAHDEECAECSYDRGFNNGEVYGLDRCIAALRLALSVSDDIARVEVREAIMQAFLNSVEGS